MSWAWCHRCVLLFPFLYHLALLPSFGADDSWPWAVRRAAIGRSGRARNVVNHGYGCMCLTKSIMVSGKARLAPQRIPEDRTLDLKRRSKKITFAIRKVPPDCFLPPNYYKRDHHFCSLCLGSMFLKFAMVMARRPWNHIVLGGSYSRGDRRGCMLDCSVIHSFHLHALDMEIGGEERRGEQAKQSARCNGRAST